MRLSHAACSIFALLAACGEEGTAPADPAEASAPSEAAPSEALAPAQDPLASTTPFDFRRMRTEPGAHEGEPRVCEVGFADEMHPIEPQERDLYPPRTAAHRTIRCEAPTGGGWLEVVFEATADAEGVVAGRRVVLVPESDTDGRHGYVVARYARTLSDAPEGAEEPGGTAPTRALGEAPERGFDFTRLRDEPALARAPRRCLIDFVSEIEIVEPRVRRRLGYPPRTQNRLNVKCLHGEGDSWIDLVFDAEAAAQALVVVPGTAIEVEITSPDGGFADRPIARLAEVP